MLNKGIKFLIENKLVALLILLTFIVCGIIYAPFNWKTGVLPRDPVAVDAIPDLGENQQIVYTQWNGRSPQDIDNQITYPLTNALLGIPGVKTIRSSSMFGASNIYVIFNDDIDFYWSRSRILEKLNSLQNGLLPNGVQPTLGPDATALGQVYWYTLEGRSAKGKVTGGWDLQELRSIQDFYIKPALSGTDGVSEVASIGGYVKEYQIDVNPNTLKQYHIPLSKVVKAVKASNQDIGVNTMEINKVEYFIRSIGYVKSLKDLEDIVVDFNGKTPIYLKDVAKINFGPATRRGILDKEGAEVVGGVVVARHGSNPMQVINNIKQKINEIASGLPSKTLKDGTTSKLTIVPFYDRSTLIHQTLGTLNEAISLEILITILVVVIMVFNLRASLLISGLLPVAVLMTFMGMKYLGVDANIVALSGIAIAIGTMVDLGIVLCENIIRHLDETKQKLPINTLVYNATSEVSGALVTAVLTTIISFIPVFTLQAEEGKLFTPLAYTKTMALSASVIVALFLIPPFAAIIFKARKIKYHKVSPRGIKRKPFFLISRKASEHSNLDYRVKHIGGGIAATILAVASVIFFLLGYNFAIIILPFALLSMAENRSWLSEKWIQKLCFYTIIFIVLILLSVYWRPLGLGVAIVWNFIVVAIITLGVLAIFELIRSNYPKILRWMLQHKKTFLAVPTSLIVVAIIVWLGISKVFGFIPKSFDAVGVNIRTTSVWSSLTHTFPGIGKEFMPSLDEGSFLLMPTSLPHAGVEENKHMLQMLDMAVAQIPEIETVVGKSGRVESALDPAPLSMYENIITYKSEYMEDDDGNRLKFKVNDKGEFLRKDSLPAVGFGAKVTKDDLILDEDGEYYRQWRPQIKSPDDIWNEIAAATKFPGITSAPKLQPIETRRIMLQTGMRAPMGIKVKGKDLKTIEDFGVKLEKILKHVNGVKPASVFADRIVGKPYMIIDMNRKKIAQYGLHVDDVQNALQVAVGGMPVSQTVEGRERYNIRVRFPRDYRNSPEALESLLIPTQNGNTIPLSQVAAIRYEQGPQMIKSEDNFLVGYVLFDKVSQQAEVDVVQHAQKAIQQEIDNGNLKIPEGITYKFTGTYENQIRAAKRLSVIMPAVFVLIFLILYFQFRSVTKSLMLFSSIFVAFAGGFILIWLYNQSWFFNINVFGANLRTIFHILPINLSVAVWVGFIALFGIATDDGVIMTTYLDQSFARNKPQSVAEIHDAVVEGGKKRIRACLMTTATTLIALLPVLTSNGKGSDIMIPMAIPVFGGMTFVLITMFIVPVLYSWQEEYQLKKASK
ncbi:efflux RND transporter permease subunit [Zhouia sp. PK063]|uniref:efflux RND transporter permease subunit n=1 Tax=Zhouia sp. PK063 TaxID=3373602 RepID=UPI0037AE06E9